MKSLRQNAAVLYFGSNFKTNAPQLMGRHSATEGFLRAFVQNADVDRFYCYTMSEQEYRDFHQRIQDFAGKPRQSAWIPFLNNSRLAEPGCLYRPGPDLGFVAWQRRQHDVRSYSICGITHTTASHDIIDSLARILISPVYPWDALICTSRAVKAMVMHLLENWRDYLQQKTGGAIEIAPQLPIIPLGVDIANFRDAALAGETRAKLRQEHGIGDDDIAVLFFGRLTPVEKANPAPMYQALEQAAKRTGKRFHLIQAGWFSSEAFERDFRSGAEVFAPSVNHLFLDGRIPEIRHNIWYAADIFTSLSDNIQETFGLTPIEAMAAGLPVIVSDWDGYRDTVRHGIDGFLIPTLMPYGQGEDIAFRYEATADHYGNYLAVTSQCVSVDTVACADAFVTLATNKELRLSMGAAGRRRAIETFDWSVVIRAYQELWGDLAERRRLGSISDPRLKDQPANPLRDDPFKLFSAYPTHLIDLDDLIALRPGADANRVKTLRAHRLTGIGSNLLATDVEIGTLLAYLARAGTCRVGAALKQLPRARRDRMYRTLGWMAKTDLVSITATKSPSGQSSDVSDTTEGEDQAEAETVVNEPNAPA